MSKPSADQLQKIGLDPKLLGQYLVKGNQSDVYLYGEDSLVKVPRQTGISKFYGELSASENRHDLSLLREYQAEYLPQTKIYGDDNFFVIIQEKLEGEHLTEANFDLVADQFKQLMKNDRQMRAETGKALDLLGYQGVISTLKVILKLSSSFTFANLMVVKSDGDFQLKIVDTNLNDLRWGSTNLFRWVVDCGATAIGWLIASFLPKVY